MAVRSKYVVKIIGMANDAHGYKQVLVYADNKDSVPIHNNWDTGSLLVEKTGNVYMLDSSGTWNEIGGES